VTSDEEAARALLARATEEARLRKARHVELRHMARRFEGLPCRPQCPNMLLYWEMIRDALARGLRVFDFGRSTPDESTYQFKRQWGAQPAPMFWEYVLLDGDRVPDDGPKSAK
jgi:hypothetical protein